MVEDKRGEVSWNIVAEQTKFIGQLIQEATMHYLKGDIGEWFNILTAIRENIDYDLKPNEEELLNTIEKDCWSYQSFWKKHIVYLKDGKTTPIEVITKKKDFVCSVRKYSRTLLKILNNLGYFPKKEDRTKLSF